MALIGNRFKLLPPGAILPVYNRRKRPTKTIVCTRKTCLWDDYKKQIVCFWYLDHTWETDDGYFDINIFTDWLRYYQDIFPEREPRVHYRRRKSQRWHVEMAHKHVQEFGVWHSGAYFGAHLEQVWPKYVPRDRHAYRRKVLREMARDLLVSG